jgi:F-type H+-transporting ATPase subunit gamma
MENLQKIEARLSSLHEFEDIIGALRAMAASHVQEAQKALAGVREYVGVIEDAIAAGATLLSRQPSALPPISPASGVMLVVGSEHGFVGGFNQRVMSHALDNLKPGQQLMVVGRRGAVHAAESGIDVSREFSMATHVGGVAPTARRVAASLDEVALAEIAFARYKRGGNYQPEIRTILPLEPALLQRADSRSPPLHHLDAESLLERLGSEYLFAEITSALVESLASENAARLQLMESADQNINARLDDLRRLAANLRQEAITSELIDVVTGSEAILHS